MTADFKEHHHTIGPLKKLTTWCHRLGQTLLELMNKCEVRHRLFALTSLLLISHFTNRRSLLWCHTVVFGMWMPHITTGYHRPVMAHFTGRWCLSEDDRRDRNIYRLDMKEKSLLCQREWGRGSFLDVCAKKTFLSCLRCKTFPHNYTLLCLQLII